MIWKQLSMANVFRIPSVNLATELHEKGIKQKSAELLCQRWPSFSALSIKSHSIIHPQMHADRKCSSRSKSHCSKFGCKIEWKKSKQFEEITEWFVLRPLSSLGTFKSNQQKEPYFFPKCSKRLEPDRLRTFITLSGHKINSKQSSVWIYAVQYSKLVHFIVFVPFIYWCNVSNLECSAQKPISICAKRLK